MKFRNILFIGLAFLLSCGDNLSPENPNNPNPLDPNSWLVPQNEVFDGGPGKDGIPSVDNPRFATSQGVTSEALDELVLGIVHNGIARAYPRTILDWHEIVNDDLDDLSVAVTYCPLTGTGIGWNRLVNGTKTTFGVSGLLYNSNLMPYDRETDSTWSQQRMQCVNGELVSETPDAVVLIETTLRTWLESYPESEIMNTDTGFNRSYGRYPYGDYRENNNRILFPLSNEDDTLESKERVLGILMGEDSYAVTFGSSNAGTEVLQKRLGGEDVVIVRNTAKNFILAFLNPDGLDFEAANSTEGVFQDSNGNIYDLSGIATSGSNQGTRLVQPTSFIGYWFSWATFYPDVELIED